MPSCRAVSGLVALGQCSCSCWRQAASLGRDSGCRCRASTRTAPLPVRGLGRDVKRFPRARIAGQSALYTPDADGGAPVDRTGGTPRSGGVAAIHTSACSTLVSGTLQVGLYADGHGRVWTRMTGARPGCWSRGPSPPPRTSSKSLHTIAAPPPSRQRGLCGADRFAVGHRETGRVVAEVRRGC